jgi:tetratricopeptide (TPR) repeat protein
MDDALIQALQAAKNPEDKAALIAEASLSTLSDETARLARQCVLFHWFDESIVAALQQAVPPDAESAQDAYKQITSLPFVEQLPSGVAYQDLTRQGLLKHYAHTQPELLKNAAQVAALAYSASTENNRHATEALFCSLISGDSASNQHLNTLLEQAMNQQDWQQMEGLFRLQEEAEQLPFVEPLPRTEQYWMLRSIVDRVQDRLDAALLDYNHALTINPQNALAYINRSIIHRQQKHRMEALADYNEALRLDPALVQTYTDIGSLENDSSDTEENDAEAPKPSEQESLDENDLAQVSHYPYVDNGILSPQPNRKRRNLIAFAVAVITVLAGSGATATLSGILAPPPSCPPDQTSCSGKCVNSLNDFHNCGRCGHACSSGQICTQGSCQRLPQLRPMWQGL